MDLLEYKAKQLFGELGLPVTRGVVVDSLDDFDKKIAQSAVAFPVVIKAQVPIGGRGKAGGIQFADNMAEAKQVCEKLLFSDLKGFRVNHLLITEKAAVKKEWYLSVILDRVSKMPLVIFSAQGGVDIEEVARSSPEKIVKVVINPFKGVQDYTVQYIIDKCGIEPAYAQQLQDIVTKLYSVFCEYSCLLTEINPLIVDDNDNLVALDGKITIDDSALYRLPDIKQYRETMHEEELVKKARSFDFLYIPIEEGGNIAVMSNGSGMLMSCIDLISKNGMTVGAALDLGGGATAERIKEAVNIVLSNSKIDTLFISVFGGITRCDEVASGIRLALEEAAGEKTVVVRMEGTNKTKGLEIIGSLQGNIKSAETIPEGVTLLKERCRQ